MTAKWTISFVVVSALAGISCTGPLPHYDWVGRDHAMATMNARASRVETVSALGRLSLRRRDRGGTQLDCAIVSRPPDLFRLRAWKFSHAVLDLTVNGDGLWMFAPKSGNGDGLGLPDSLSAEHIVKSWSLVIGHFSPDSWEPCASSLSETFSLCGIRGTRSEGVVCEIDRDTLTTQSCTLRNDAGGEQFQLAFERYRLFGDVVLATRVRASSGDGAFIWLLDEVDINEALAPKAFVPPRRAKKQP